MGVDEVGMGVDEVDDYEVECVVDRFEIGVKTTKTRLICRVGGIVAKQ